MGIPWHRRRQWLGAVAPLAIFALALTIFAWVMSYAKPGGADLFGNGSRAFVSVFFSKGSSASVAAPVRWTSSIRT